MRRFAMPLLLFLVLAGFLAVGLRHDPRVLPSALVDKPAPAFTSERLDDAGATFSPAQMAGKVWIMNVWASWCTSCRVEHPMLMALAQRGVAPLVGLNYKDGRDAGRKWLAAHGDPYMASAFDPAGRIGMDYGVYGVPETFVIDAQGRVRLRHAGPLTQEVIERQIVPLVKELGGA